MSSRARHPDSTRSPLRREHLPPLYALTAPVASQSTSQVTAQLIEGGARWIQIREKKAGDAERAREVATILASKPSTVSVFVNDRVDLALVAGAQGVHLGDRDLPAAAARAVCDRTGHRMIIGVSTHGVDEAIIASGDPAVDYVAIGPIFASTTKMAREPLGVGAIRRIREKIDKPLVAIGGITADNIRAVLQGGADAAAVIAAIYEGGRISENVRRLMDAGEASR
ncbi:MAG TPA: thiamine phosphate synthase [Thermoanaerobaculia bacterium]|nr:thiamine phosphate synthase [Thermoanaerobaculia bacterium]